MMKLKTNQIKFNEELFKLLEKSGLSDEDFFDCIRALYPKTFGRKSAKIIQIEEFSSKLEVNEFIKDKTLRGTGVYKIMLSPYTAQYLVIYYKEI